MFKIDKQTLSDLNALQWEEGSLLYLFDTTFTLGGRDVLYQYFQYPLKDVAAIEGRQVAIQYLVDQPIDCFFDKYMMVDLEHYQGQTRRNHTTSKTGYFLNALSDNFLSISYQRDKLLIRQSIREVALLIVRLHDFFQAAAESGRDIGELRGACAWFLTFVAHFDLQELALVAKDRNYSLTLALKYDARFRDEHREALVKLFRICYELDALRAVARVYQSMELHFPTFDSDPQSPVLLDIEGAYNLALKTPVKNNIKVRRSQPIWFLTGANMTGKSTLLKTVGSCLYLAHLGFPVPADSMCTSLFNGLMTTINLGDNIASGYSHFFNEVHRVKAVATAIQESGPMVILLDELFKGTNYHDTYAATLRLIDSIGHISHSIFFISSHITELAATFQTQSSISLRCLETTVDEEKGVDFTYRLKEGIADERLGMWFLERESVFEAFKKI